MTGSVGAAVDTETPGGSTSSTAAEDPKGSKYASLRIDMPLLWRIRLWLRVYAGKLFYRVPLLAKVPRFIGSVCTFLGSLEKEERDRREDLQLLQEDDSDAQEFDSPYGYSDAAYELAVTNKYRVQLESKDPHAAISESWVLYEHAISTLDGLLRANEIRAVLDFGVGYAHLNHVLAKRFLDVGFLGIDRSMFTKLYNEGYFSDVKNMEFLAGDIFELLEQRRFDQSVFFHARTMLLMPMTFIDRIYTAVKRAGFQYIVGIEQLGISRQTLKPYAYSDQFQRSVLYRNNMYTHNYPEILKRNGFSLTDIRLVKTGHPHADYRLLSFTAKT